MNSYARKPKKGTKHYYQKITTKRNKIGEVELLEKPIHVPAAFNKAGVKIREAFIWYKPTPISIRHQIAPRKVG